jgi:hypothetical protein
VIRAAAEKSKKKLLPVWLIGIVVRFKRYENGVDFGQLFGVAHLECPALLGFVVDVQDSKTLYGRGIGLAFALGLVGILRVDHLALVEIECVKDSKASWLHYISSR